MTLLEGQPLCVACGTLLGGFGARLQVQVFCSAEWGGLFGGTLLCFVMGSIVGVRWWEEVSFEGPPVPLFVQGFGV